jgi:hypothetical protein
MAVVEWPEPRLVDIGNRVLCARVMGCGPTVVLEAGGAGEGTTETFGGFVEEQLAAFATVLTYDRVGSGRSGGRPHRTVAEMADDLDARFVALGGFCHGSGSPVVGVDTHAEFKQVTILFADVVHSMDIAATVGAGAASLQAQGAESGIVEP